MILLIQMIGMMLTMLIPNATPLLLPQGQGEHNDGWSEFHYGRSKFHDGRSKFHGGRSQFNDGRGSAIDVEIKRTSKHGQNHVARTGFHQRKQRT